MALIIILRININYLGVPDIGMIIFNSLTFDTLAICFSLLPTMILFTSLTPNAIEASMFALFTGVFNFSTNVGAPLLGSMICRYFGVSSDDMSNYYKLVVV